MNTTDISKIFPNEGKIVDLLEEKGFQGLAVGFQHDNVGFQTF